MLRYTEWKSKGHMVKVDIYFVLSRDRSCRWQFVIKKFWRNYIRKKLRFRKEERVKTPENRRRGTGKMALLSHLCFFWLRKRYFDLIISPFWPSHLTFLTRSKYLSDPVKVPCWQTEKTRVFCNSLLFKHLRKSPKFAFFRPNTQFLAKIAFSSPLFCQFTQQMAVDPTCRGLL